VGFDPFNGASPTFVVFAITSDHSTPAPTRAERPAASIDYVVHSMGRNHDGAVRLADYLVAGGLHQDRPVLPRRESHGGLDIGRALRHHNHRRHQLVIQVPDHAFVVVSRVARQ
jgi:hypothetical protein